MVVIKLAVIFLVSSFVCTINAQCLSCDPKTNVTCLSITQYFKCENGAIDLQSLTSCSDGNWCDSSHADPCVEPYSSSNDQIVPPSCPVDPVPIRPFTQCPPTSPQVAETTTPPPGTKCDVNQICAAKGEGRFPRGTDCTQYIYCYMSQSTKAIKGSVITCPFGTKFEPASRDCKARYVCPQAPVTTAKPVAASATLAPGQLFDLLLEFGAQKYSVVVKPLE